MTEAGLLGWFSHLQPSLMTSMDNETATQTNSIKRIESGALLGGVLSTRIKPVEDHLSSSVRTSWECSEIVVSRFG